MHLILLTDALGRVLETVVSRCQLVRFDPLPAARIAAALEAEGVTGRARAAPARGWRSATPRARASWPRPRAAALRAEVEALRAAALLGGASRRRAVATAARARRGAPGRGRGGGGERAASERLELEPKGRERKAIEKEFEESAKRDGRRARTRGARARR